jgi:hypothetical protein
MTQSKLIPFSTPEKHERPWYTWGPVLAKYDALGVELLRDTKNGNWHIITQQGNSCETIESFVCELAARAFTTPGISYDEGMSTMSLFMEWLMKMVMRHV